MTRKIENELSYQRKRFFVSAKIDFSFCFGSFGVMLLYTDQELRRYTGARLSPGQVSQWYCYRAWRCVTVTSLPDTGNITYQKYKHDHCNVFRFGAADSWAGKGGQCSMGTSFTTCTRLTAWCTRYRTSQWTLPSWRHWRLCTSLRCWGP